MLTYSIGLRDNLVIEFSHSGQRCLIIGAGLIGQSIGGALTRDGWHVTENLASLWNDPDAHARQLSASCRGGHDVRIVWAAGRAGFNAPSSQTRAEFASFKSLVASVGVKSSVASFQFISSAGGLFEGRRTVSHSDAPNPQRPYGRMKLAQEAVVQRIFPNAGIHRVSSAFGARTPTMRRSLISELVENTIRQRTTTISGSPDTLRDFVYADDIGQFVADAAVNGTAGVHHLVSGRPTAIGEAVALAHRICGRPPLIRYVPPTNDAPITFSSSIRAAGFRPTALSVAIHAMERHSRGTGAPNLQLAPY